MKKITLLLSLLITVLTYAQSPIITGYIDSTCPGADGRTLEIYVDGTVDFTDWNIVRQSNGGGFTTTIDISGLGSVTDDFVYVTNDENILLQEFGISTNFIVSGSINGNGNDGFQLNDPTDAIIDRFGEDGVDGSGTAWDHLDSYAYRLNGSTPNGGNFNPANWAFGGPNLLDGEGLCNAGTVFSTLVPFGTYSPTGGGTASIVTGADVANLFYFEGNFDPTNAEGSFTVQGLNLTEDITVTAPTNFEVSLTSEGSFSNAINLAETDGEVPSTEVFVRLQSGLSAGDFNGEVTASSSGVTEVINVSGEVLAATPQLDVQTGDISGLNYDLGEGPSTEVSFIVEGQFLIDNINITVPSEFEVSLTSGTGFSNNIEILQTGGNASETVFVRLASGLAEGPYSGTLEVSSVSADTETRTLSGNVFGEVTNDMIITGVFDGPLSGGTPKVIEIYVVRDISDMSTFGVGSANNGDGTDGEEFTFPETTATAGDFIYISSEAPNFNTFFGFDSDYVSSVANNNGDDAIELFQNGTIIDTFGDINVDGSGESWDYLDGWAYRNNNTGPDGTAFVVGNWTFSGINENDDDTSQASATNPWPIGTYTTTLNTNIFDITSFKLFPNPVSNGVIYIESSIEGEFEIDLYNMLGQRVLNTHTSKRIDVSNLNAGVYLLKIKQGSSSLTKKVIIE
ncbi:T9SS type A sorting domain-containing protein [Psychroflexus tropicus]|uniref:T9SS type A sorting domain-containing protein n=1 Tax=Psychroflexus tropicus TaxID=197345 RepID=UPI000372F128|nr:T9SS type A sorting domain-containing protein [Psychroflexus tropicus]